MYVRMYYMYVRTLHSIYAILSTYLGSTIQVLELVE